MVYSLKWLYDWLSAALQILFTTKETITSPSIRCGQLVNLIALYISTRKLVFHDQAARLKGKAGLNIEDM